MRSVFRRCINVVLNLAELQKRFDKVSQLCGEYKGILGGEEEEGGPDAAQASSRAKKKRDRKKRAAAKKKQQAKSLEGFSDAMKQWLEFIDAPESSKRSKYYKEAQKRIPLMLESADAPGWISLGTKKGVDIYKQKRDGEKIIMIRSACTSYLHVLCTLRICRFCALCAFVRLHRKGVTLSSRSPSQKSLTF